MLTFISTDGHSQVSFTKTTMTWTQYDMPGSQTETFDSTDGLISAFSKAADAGVYFIVVG